MFKELLTMFAISPMITNQVTTPYLSINQFVIFNNITDINLALDNPQNPRGAYTFSVDIDQDEEYMYLLNDSKGLYFEDSVSSNTYYLYDWDGNFINGNVNQFLTWSDYFKPMTLGLDFESMRNDYINALIENIDFENFYEQLSDALYDYDYFSYNGDVYVQLHDDYSLSMLDAFRQVFKEVTYYYDVSIGLNNYTYSPYANYNFEFTGFANGSIGDNGPMVSLNGDQNVTYHVSSNTLSQGRLIIRLSNLTNLDYLSQFVLDDYPYYDDLQIALGNSYDINDLLAEISSLKSQNERLQRTIELYESGSPMQNLIWTVAGTPWESFKNIWNVNVLGVNISGLVTGLITALIIIWIVKKIFK